MTSFTKHSLKNQIDSIIKSLTLSYYEKMNQLIELLKDIMHKNVEFVESNDDKLFTKENIKLMKSISKFP